MRSHRVDSPASEAVYSAVSIWASAERSALGTEIRTDPRAGGLMMSLLHVLTLHTDSRTDFKPINPGAGARPLLQILGPPGHSIYAESIEVSCLPASSLRWSYLSIPTCRTGHSFISTSLFVSRKPLALALIVFIPLAPSSRRNLPGEYASVGSDPMSMSMSMSHVSIWSGLGPSLDLQEAVSVELLRSACQRPVQQLDTSTRSVPTAA